MCSFSCRRHILSLTEIDASLALPIGNRLRDLVLTACDSNLPYHDLAKHCLTVVQQQSKAQHEYAGDSFDRPLVMDVTMVECLLRVFSFGF